jgi:hypothetical protein
MCSDCATAVYMGLWQYRQFLRTQLQRGRWKRRYRYLGWGRLDRALIGGGTKEVAAAKSRNDFTSVDKDRTVAWSKLIVGSVDN